MPFAGSEVLDFRSFLEHSTGTRMEIIVEIVIGMKFSAKPSSPNNISQKSVASLRGDPICAFCISSVATLPHEMWQAA